MDNTAIVESIRARVVQCRRLAASIADKQAVAALNKMADEGEADIRRLLQPAVTDRASS